MYKILLIDDDPTEAFFLEDALAEACQTVMLTHEPSGARGLDALKTQKPDLVLLDLRMPGLSGFEVLDEIRSNSSFADLIVIMLSTSSREHEIEEANTRGANGYIVKPHTPDGYLDMIRELPGITSDAA